MMDLIEHGESCHLEYYEAVEANEPLKVFFTLRITGVPKGIVSPHEAWIVGDYEVLDYLFSLKDGDVVFTSADVGCITFSRIMYGTLMHVREVNVHGRSSRLL
jgi:acetyl-CoA synthetase